MLNDSRLHSKALQMQLGTQKTPTATDLRNSQSRQWAIFSYLFCKTVSVFFISLSLFFFLSLAVYV